MPKKNEIYLTESEIYEIEKMSGAEFFDYLPKIPSEKRELALHIFSICGALVAWKVMLDEHKEGKERLIRLLEENGIKYE